MNNPIKYSVDNEYNYHKLTFQLKYTYLSNLDYKLSLIPSSYNKYYQFPDGLYENIITEVKKELEPLILTIDIMGNETNTPWLDIGNGLMLHGSDKKYTIWYNINSKCIFMNIYL